MDLLRYLLDAGADINAANDRGETVLMRFAAEIKVVPFQPLPRSGRYSVVDVPVGGRR